MTTKRVRVSDDDITYYTLPGNQADFRDEAGQINDTVFGQDYESNQPGIVSWTCTSNALFKGFAGYVASVYKSGTPTTMTTEAMSLVSGKTYVVTNSAKRMIDPRATITVFDNAVNHTADVTIIDYLLGRVTFSSGYTVTGPVTITATYLPMAVSAKCRGFTLTMGMNTIDVLDFETAAANSGTGVMDAGMKNVSLELTQIHATGGYRTNMYARDLLVVELNLDSPVRTTLRGFFKVSQRNQSGNNGEREDVTVNLQLWVPDGDLAGPPLRQDNASNTTLNMGIQKVVQAYLSNIDTVYLKYLPSGSEDGSGFKGLGLVQEIVISNSIDGMVEYRFTFRGAGATSAI